MQQLCSMTYFQSFFIFFIILLTTISSANAGEIEKICNSKGLLTKVPSSQVYGTFGSLYQTMATKPKVHLIGEDHFQDTQFLKELIHSISESLPKDSVNCLALEASSISFLRKQIEDIEKIIANQSQFQALSKDDQEWLSDFTRHFSSLIEAGEDANLKIVGGDAEGYLENYTETTLNYRDYQMKYRILNYLKNTCGYIIYIIGKSHISADENGRSTLPMHLREANIEFATYNVIGAPTQINSLRAWSIKECPIEDGSAMFFKNGSYHKGQDLYPNLPTERQLQWSEFDYSIIYKK